MVESIYQFAFVFAIYHVTNAECVRFDVTTIIGVPLALRFADKVISASYICLVRISISVAYCSSSEYKFKKVSTDY